VVVDVLGKSKPFVLLLSSRIELTLGELVPMPIWEETDKQNPCKNNRGIKIFFIECCFETKFPPNR
jgi:hypothetical protein